MTFTFDRQKMLISILLIAATAAVYGQVIGFKFVNLDDNPYVLDNPDVLQGLTIRGVLWAFTTFHADFWHPLTWLSHMLDVELFGLWAGGHHLTNLLLHLASTVILFLALAAMTGANGPSAAVAALFALHPLHVESVAWVAERKDVLSTFFFMLTVLAYVKIQPDRPVGALWRRRAFLRSGPHGEADARHRPRDPGASGFLAAETVQPARPQEPADPSAASRGKDSFSHDRVSFWHRGRFRADPQRRGDALFRRLPGVDPDRERDGFLRHVPRADRLAHGTRSLLSARR